MRFIDKAACKLWLTERNIPMDDAGRPSAAVAFKQGLRIGLPDELGRRLAFSKWVWRMVAEEHTTLVWVTDWSIWESSEHMPMATALRRGLGTDASIREAPGCVVDPRDSDDGMSLFLLATIFSWDCWIVADGTPHSLIFVSHDDFIAVYLPPGQQLTDVEHFNLPIDVLTPG